MKNQIIAALALGSLIIGGSAFVASNAMAQTPAAPVVAQSGQARLERHPELRKALRALTNAQKFLESANTDFGGHKKLAMDATANALAEVKAAMAYDKH